MIFSKHLDLPATKGAFPYNPRKAVTNHEQNETEFPVDEQKSDLQDEEENVLGGLWSRR